MRLRKDIWNTWKIDGFRYSITQDQASAGGTIHYEIRKKGGEWYQRLSQHNGGHYSHGPIEKIPYEQGEAKFAEFRAERQREASIRQKMKKEFPNSGW